MNRLDFLIIVICLLTLNSCKKEEQSFKDLSGVEPDFKEYVDRFVSEADLRNVIIDFSKLKVRYSDTLKHYCGYGMPNDVVISRSCWEYYEDVQKEILLFHELGHSIFNRAHDDSKLPNGDFKTIMNPKNFFYLYTESTPERKKYYLDELFDQSTPPPYWTAIKTKPTIVFKDTIQFGSPLWQFVNQPGNTFIGKFCSTSYFSKGTSLSIEPSNSLQGWAKWTLTYSPQGINQSDKLVLSAKIKTVGVTKGGGVTLCMEGFNVNNNRMFFVYKTDSGTMDFTEWKAEVPYFISDTKTIYIKLVQDRSQGITYFDDVTLTKFE
jgi:hypothetical protein